MMNYLKLTLLAATMVSFALLDTATAQYTGTGSNSSVEYVQGYTKSNGTYVNSYYRTKANSYNLDNFSAKGNYNPYTGSTGTKTYKSAYNNYNSSSSSSSSIFGSSSKSSSSSSSLFDYSAPKIESTYTLPKTTSYKSTYSFSYDYD